MSLLKFLAVCIGSTVFFGFSVSSGSTHVDAKSTDTVRTVPAADMLPLQRSLFWLLGNNQSVPPPFTAIHQKVHKGLDDLLYRFYQENDFFPYWVTKYGPTHKAHILISVLRRVDEEGLDLERYALDEITDLLVSRESNDLAQLDLMLTLALYLYIGDMMEGAASPSLLDPRLFSAARSTAANRPAMLRRSIVVADLRQFLKNLSPYHYEYQSLKKVLARRDFRPASPCSQCSI
ncbi:MAG: hypothetical protein D3916_03055, partial [Candidatus Electrothrix sp. MAN1_4]|nr:hypothetical protein [Candidatus Electrothrix sp. MAN1_4]